MRASAEDEDPLAAALRPPLDESPEARAIRLAREEEAARVSQAIDEAIRVERLANKKNKVVRVLLLGQSESGKSTTLRQFQRIYTPTAFREERIHWRVIIQLNVIRSVHTILGAVTAHRRQTSRTRVRTISGPRWDSRSQVTSVRTDGKGKGKGRVDLESDFEDEDERPIDPSARSFYADSYSEDESQEDAELDAISQRLMPLRRVEAMLKERLVPPSEDEPADLGGGPLGLTVSALGLAKEVFVRPGKWRAGGAGTRPASAVAVEAADESQRALFECRFDLMQLWSSMRVREILALRRIRPEEESGFFLNDLDRVTGYNYVPTDDDVLRARLKTIGVSEYKFEMEAGDQGTQWRIVDVGGSPTWVPFFDSVEAIIFLAPISAFDQVLSEDPKVNRLEDSVLLWKGICQNKLLAKVDLVLFLNKCDILQRKLDSGIRLARYVKSYDDRPNDMETASKYFRGKFSAIQRTYSPVPRRFYGYCTSVTESTTTAGILASVRDIVLRQNLRSLRLA
ncbi:G-alpha-domain-containing protein [Lactarius akahatsu]|uniref:G-alpha-domain-containing protein n=1 Tax=Lactarius akahatsu TaxID=416441 RepID=A0AAD4QE55_9AGAM|nr:G-alpha-domain-containing protein [Lactarius akahatsu]